MTIPRPDSSEHPPYASTYVNAAADALARHGLDDLMPLLERQPADLATLLDGVTEEGAHGTYAPGKWTLIEALLHTIDTERVWSYRMLRAARGDRTPLPGYEQDDWVPQSGANTRTLASIVDEFRIVREALLALLRPLDAEQLARRTVASGHEVSVRGLAWMIAGHTDHHLRLTRERYPLPRRTG
jgi:hypothetical protein